MQRGLNKPAIGLLLIVLLLSGAVLYYNLALTSANANVSLLKSMASELQNRNTELERAVSRLNSNVSFTGLYPVQIYEESNRSVVTVQGSRVISVLTFFGPQNAVETDLGSGFIVRYSDSYYVVTNFHVVDSLVNITVTFWNGDAYSARVVGSDPYSDLAILSSNALENDLTALTLINSSSVQVGEPVMAIGNPFGLSGTVTIGIVSQVGRTIQYQSTTSTFAVADTIQFSAPINPGNSGGPLLNSNGMVIGVTTAAVNGAQGVGFAIPSDTIIRELPLLVTVGRYDRHPYIGLRGVDMNFQLAQAMGINNTYGVLVESVDQGSPAAKAGVLSGRETVTIGQQQYLIGGDVIVSVNGTRIVNSDVLNAYMEEHAIPGEVMQLEVDRSNRYITLNVLVGSQPTQ